jgi:hypothetical protein
MHVIFIDSPRKRRVLPCRIPCRDDINVAGKKEMSSGLPGDQITHPLLMRGYPGIDTKTFEKNTDVLDYLIRPPGRVLAPDLYQIRTNPADMHGRVSVKFSSG